MRALGSPILLVALTTPLFAQRIVEDLVDDLRVTERAADAQLELVRRGAPAAGALGRALRVGWPGDANDLVARGAAARVLMEFGADGVAAFDELVACVEDPYVPADAVRFAAMALERVGPFAGARRAEFLAFLEAHPGWTRSGAGLIRKEFYESWSRVASSLVVDGRGAGVDELIDALDSDNPFARVTAARALAARRDELADAAPRIRDALRRAVGATFERGEPLVWSVGQRPQRWRMNDDVARWLRTEMSLALAHHEPDDELAALGHSQRLFALDPAVRVDAARALALMRRPDAGQWLLDAARRGPTEVAIAALGAIERTGPSLAHLGPALLAFESSAEPDVRAAAERVLRIVAPDAERVAPIRPRFELLGVGLPAETTIPIALERRRIEAWLDRDGGRNRALLQVDVRHLERFHAMSAEDGGPLDPRMRWVAVRSAPDELRPGHWEPLRQAPAGPVVPAAPRDVVGPDRERLRPLPWIVELLPSDGRLPALGANDVRLDVRDQGVTQATFRALDPAAGDLITLKQDLFARHGSLAIVVDGLAVWLLSIDEQTALDHPGGGIGILPAAVDRTDALRALAIRGR